MKILVFAGGVGTRLWPLSRRQTPKQFGQIIGEKSTLRLTIERLLTSVSPKDIYIATGREYGEIIKAQLPEIPARQIILEPERRDVGPAVGLAIAVLARDFPDEPVAIFWSDHLVKKERRLKEVLEMAEKQVLKNKNLLIFIGQRARFANQNIGWIEFGDLKEEIRGTKIFHFRQLIYRPKLEEAEEFLKNENFAWNPGYFVTTPSFLLSQYEKFAPEMFSGLKKIQETVGAANFQETLRGIYPTFEKISFDNLILERLNPKNVLVIAADLGWSDVGAWEALKEALEVKTHENVTRGKVLLTDSRDNLVFNLTDQLAVGIDLNGVLIINTDDVLLVCHKNSVPKIKKLVESLAGTENEHLT